MVKRRCRCLHRLRCFHAKKPCTQPVAKTSASESTSGPPEEPRMCPRVLWSKSTIIRLYAHCCSDELRFFSVEHVFGSSKHLSTVQNVFLLCQAFVQLCWDIFCSAKHFFFNADHLFYVPSIFSSVLSRSQLFRAFFGHAKHFSAFSIISLLCWEVSRFFEAFFRYAEHLVCSAKHFSDVPSKRFSSMLSVFFCSAAYFFALLCTARHGRKILGRAEKGSA